MVKINYSWNAEMPNTRPHADNDRACERERDREKEHKTLGLGRLPREGQLTPIDRVLIG